MFYEFPSELTRGDILAAFDSAQSQLIRFDERLRDHPLAEGLQQRLHFVDTIAAAKEEGDLIHLEDLVLRDAGVSNRAGDIPLARALLTLRARRLAAARSPQWILSNEGLAEIAGVAREPPNQVLDERSQPFAPEEGAFDRLVAWRNALRGCDSAPPLLAAAIAFDWWTTAPPILRNPGLGALLVAAYMRKRELARHHLPALTLGIRAASYRPLTKPSLVGRVIGFYGAVGSSADRGMKELARLTNAKEILRMKIKGRRTSSRLPALIDLLLSRPLITIPMAAKHLRVSQQAVAAMIPQLGSIPRELTDRRSYRAWGVL